MATWKSVNKRLAAELERQGASIRWKKSDGSFVARGSTPGTSAAFHQSPGHAAQSRHNVAQKFRLIGCHLPDSFKF